MFEFDVPPLMEEFLAEGRHEFDAEGHEDVIPRLPDNDEIVRVQQGTE